MTDLRPTIAPKSDQLNSDDLIGGPITITVGKVLLTKAADQPIAVHFQGDNDKPYKPCLSMRRVMVQCWGADGNKYAGRSMTLYRDDKVAFGGVAVGGIRISHMSHIDGEKTMALTAGKAQRKPYTVRPLALPPEARGTAPPVESPDPSPDALDGRLSDYADGVEFEIDTATDARALHSWFNGQVMKAEDWMALRDADGPRAEAIKRKAIDKVKALKESA